MPTTTPATIRPDRSRTARRLAVAALTTALGLGALLQPTAASAQESEYPAEELPPAENPAPAPAEAPEEPSPSGVALRPNRVPRGGTVTVTGGGFAAGEPVTVVLDGNVVATTNTDDDGFFQVSFPADAPPGEYLVTVTVGGLVYELSLEITGPGGTFADDDGSVHEAAIEQLVSAGITSGCSSGEYCPELPVTRGQMATFLDRLVQLPPAEGGMFVDDDGSVHEGAIERLAAAGVTSGCAPDRFCPDVPVNRAQMATFLDRLAGFPLAEGGAFVDDDGSVHEGAIERLAAAGVTSGCAPDRFCPDLPVTRAQMATFVNRTFGLPPLDVMASVSTDLDQAGKGDAERGTAAPDLDPGQVAEHRDGNGQLDSVEVGTHGGGHIHGVCDVDGDGEHEIILENPVDNPGPLTTYDLVFDPDTDIDVVWVGTRGGGSIVAMTDLDGDKDCDIVVLDPVSAPGSKITEKADGDKDADVVWVGARGGITFVRITDLDGDGENDIQLRDATLTEGQAIDVHFDPTLSDGTGDSDVDVRYLP